MISNRKIPFYRYKKFKDKYLLTFDNGAWIVLDENEFYEVYSQSLSDETLEKLKNKFILEDFSNRYVNYYWNRYNGTSLNIILPTLRCDYTCKYCYALRRDVNEKQYDMSKETADKVLDFIFQSPAKHIVLEFSGGEPLLNFEVVKYMISKSDTMKRKYQKSVEFSIVTNSSQLDEEKARFLMQYGVGVCISFDGVKEVHDYNRKMTYSKESSYENVVKWIHWFHDKGYSYIFAIPVITKKTFQYWKENIEEYVHHKIESYRFKFVSHFGFASNPSIWKEIGYTPEEFVEYWKKTLDYIVELNKRGIKIKEDLTTYMLRNIYSLKSSGYAEMEIPCGAVIGQLLYNYDGSIYPCDEARIFPKFRIGSVYEMKYADLFSSSITKKMINSSMLVESCYYCAFYPYCGTCVLENYSKNNSFVINIPNSYRCRIHGKMYEYLFEKIITDYEYESILRKWVM